MANRRTLNVVVAGDSRDFDRMVDRVDRGADRIDRKFETLNFATASLGAEMGGLSLRVGSFAGSIGAMTPVLAGAVPAIAAVGTAVVALGSSLAAAGAGAGALGAGFAASLAPIAVVGKQVTSRFEEIKKAYEAVQTAQREGTAESKKNADQAMQSLSANERAMVGSLGRLSSLQDKVLGGASDRVFGGLAKAIDILAPKLEGLAKPFDRLGDAIGGNIERVAKLLSNGPWQDALQTFVDSATTLVRPLTTIFVSVGNIIRDVAVEAIPYVQEAVRGVARWFSDLDREATRSKVGDVVGMLVEHTKSWFNLFRELGGLVVNVFGSTQAKGKGLVDTLAGIVSAVSDFVGEMRSGEGAGGKFAQGIKDAFDTVRSAVTRVRRAITNWVDDNRGDIRSIVNAFKTVGRFAKDVFEDTVVPIVRRMVRAIGPIITELAKTVRGVVRTISGLFSGDWEKAWSGAKQAVSSGFRAIRRITETSISNLWEVLKDLGPKLVRAIARGIINSHKAIANGILEGIRAAAKAVPGLAGDVLKGLGKAITSAISKGFEKLNPFGDGLGDGIGKNMIPQFGGGLMGARPNMAPVAGIASRFGLGVSSGMRPGSITSSGNKSYHSTGEALDIAGPPAGMLGFFNFMKRTAGGSLAELIYTPGGSGIRNGAPHTYSGQVAKDHYDHVHVAIDSGVPGVGDGIGQAVSTAYGPPWNAMNGTGVTATGVDLRPAKQAYGIAVDPNVLTLGKNYYVWPNPFGHKGPFKAFDTGGAIKGNRIDFYDWRGRSTQMAWGRKTVKVSDDPALNYSGRGKSSGGAGGGGGGSSSGGGQSSFAAGQKAAQKAAGAALTEQRSLVGPGGGGYEQRLADIGLDRARNEGNTQATIKLVAKEGIAKQQRLAKIRKALKRRLKPETRQRLTEEATQIIADLDALSELMYELTGGQAGINADGIRGGTAAAAAERAAAAGGADGTSADSGGADAPNVPTEFDFLDLALANAESTVGKEDDVAALTGIKDFWARQVWAARASGDVSGEAQAQRAFKAAMDALTGALDENTRAQEERDALLRQQVDNQNKIIALAQQGPTILAAIVAAVSGDIGGKVGLGFQTPGFAGGVASYSATGRS